MIIIKKKHDPVGTLKLIRAAERKLNYLKGGLNVKTTAVLEATISTSRTDYVGNLSALTALL